jgi:hypothetical protein
MNNKSSDTSDSSTDSNSTCSTSHDKRRNSLILLAGHHLLFNKTAYPPCRRGKKIKRPRRHPNHVIQASLNDNLFATEFRMSYKSFKKLYGLLYLDVPPAMTAGDDTSFRRRAPPFSTLPGGRRVGVVAMMTVCPTMLSASLSEPTSLVLMSEVIMTARV